MQKVQSKCAFRFVSTTKIQPIHDPQDPRNAGITAENSGSRIVPEHINKTANTGEDTHSTL
ncbi:hypothetical protein T265_02469 [Opisthorchis viverrini]|uniref:Uncharacterized protein n=1 Tax=Opisthorchis viverrini TaxID=6198 RepID=A0A074ZW00_OPIVI|nr:hypothetical protein T265_02469 [Opisthorchis viverrini]KER31286.1 hypothetical protein T265_02469 [Opisthorchis viverrini]